MQSEPVTTVLLQPAVFTPTVFTVSGRPSPTPKVVPDEGHLPPLSLPTVDVSGSTHPTEDGHREDHLPC